MRLCYVDQEHYRAESQRVISDISGSWHLHYMVPSLCTYNRQIGKGFHFSMTNYIALGYKDSDDHYLADAKTVGATLLGSMYSQ